MPKCGHHATGLPECSAILENDPICSQTCVTNNLINYAEDKQFASSNYHLKTVDDIKQDIYLYGSVTGAFTVYEDFLNYKSGIYQHLTGSALGGHAIKIIGWGFDSGLNYWLCVNSWNDTWGDNGTFKILMNDSGINDSVYAGQI